ncbi:fused MFS/spermidine synthase [Belnapia sp. T6]|uniref:Fused MFS/spermidine synthase n=1 Tax=Belnapia mucosa TaxID=2804532 RepID=A0ABS1V278_9PROT|nr:fused MFS/spermidine synthase [Belnapia mucosa]MBL6455784.1 fused MFS/spermidine synthase [Belnapia mucosa]
MQRLMLAFFCSGFGALLCQIVWQRMLGIFAGSDTVSAALVVGAFLAGLGLGSIIGAKLADRLTPVQALLGFALCEVGVAISALISKPFLYDWLALGLVGQVDSPIAIFALCFVGLVIPTTLMGASLPLLCRSVATTLDTVAERIGRLYGLNTLGAGLGALLGGWLVVGNLGFVGTLWLAAAFDLLAASLALTLLPQLRATPAQVLHRSPAVPAPFGSLSLWCLLVFLSGYVIVALEILWVRLLGQVGQYHAYLFSTVLGVFLLADGAGMTLAARMVRRMADPRPAFFITQGAGFVLATLLIGALWLAVPNPPLSWFVPVDYGRFGLFAMSLTTILVVLVVAPPAFQIGMTFPFVQRAVQQDLASVGARVGWVQLANIAGNAAGSIGTGLITLHYLGSMGTLKLLAGLSCLLLLGWLWHAGRGRRLEAGLALACAVALIALPGNGAFWSRMHGQAPNSFAAWSEDRSGVAFYRETPQRQDFAPDRFFIMGYSQGRVPFLPIHMLLGAIGPLVHPAPERVLAIGVGSGGTPWGAMVSPATREIRAIELIKPVLDTLQEIAVARPESALAALLADPRLRLEHADGRLALARGQELYDVIEADAILPQTSHSGLLYSVEFLKAVKARLAPGGIYVQYAASARVVETFAAVFPHAVLLQPFPVLIGSQDPISFDHKALLAKLNDPAVVAHMRRGNPATENLAKSVSDPAYIWRPETLRDPASLTDMFPRDEFFVNNQVSESWYPRNLGQAQSQASR